MVRKEALVTISKIEKYTVCTENRYLLEQVEELSVNRLRMKAEKVEVDYEYLKSLTKNFGFSL